MYYLGIYHNVGFTPNIYLSKADIIPLAIFRRKRHKKMGEKIRAINWVLCVGFPRRDTRVVFQTFFKIQSQVSFCPAFICYFSQKIFYLQPNSASQITRCHSLLAQVRFPLPTSPSVKSDLHCIIPTRILLCHLKGEYRAPGERRLVFVLLQRPSIKATATLFPY